MSDLPSLKSENIANHIYFIRGFYVIPDFDLASLYGVETRALKHWLKKLISWKINTMRNLSWCLPN